MLRAFCMSRVRRSAFTLIEILVVVAIIALLITILLPSLARAREQARQSVCLSNLHQNGLGFSGYSADHKGKLPMCGRFRYTLAEGSYYVFGDGGDTWIKVNNGAIYPRWIGKEVNLFYCPSNKDADADNPTRGAKAFLNRHLNPEHSDPDYVDSHNAGNSPIGAYAYALPAAPGQSPRDAGAKMYPKEVMEGSPYYLYMNDPMELTDDQAASFLGHFPQATRGKNVIHALLTDAYFGGYRGYHLNGFNVLYGDFHAKRVFDPSGTIIAHGTGGGSKYYVGDLWDGGKAFMVWDYFGRQH